MTFFTLGVPAGILAIAPSAQARPKRQNPSQPPQQKEDDPNQPKPDPKLILEANQKEIKKNVERLYDLASELKAEVEKTDSVHVLSVVMIKKTDEIEKLAKEIKSRAKG
jgi:predicted alpha/beta hydrolase family esterase